MKSIKHIIFCSLLVAGFATTGNSQSQVCHDIQQWICKNGTCGWHTKTICSTATGRIEHKSDIIDYQDWFGKNWRAKVEGNTFIHAPNGDFSRAHRDTRLDYLHWYGTKWSVKLDGNTFIHAPDRDFSRAHRDTRIDYLHWHGSYWSATKENNSFTHSPK